jgi:membrane-associated phospholipid phosphatase
MSAWAPRTKPLLLVAAGLVLLLVMPSLDKSLLDGSTAWGRDGLGRLFAEGAYWAGHGAVQIALCLLWVGVAKYYNSKAGVYQGATGMAAVIGSGILVQVIKHLVGRARPRLTLPPWEHFGPSFDNDLHSFPSGHTTTSFALAAVLAARFPRQAWIFYSLASLVGLGRLVSGSHYPSDVLAGVILGLAVGWALADAAKRRAGERST